MDAMLDPLHCLGPSMMTFILSLLFLSAIAPTAALAATVPTAPLLLDVSKPAIDDLDGVVSDFLAAVDRGELSVFSRRIDRTMITPARVEYVIDLITRARTIKVYSVLKEPIPVPNQHGCQARAVSVNLDGGTIVETESHIWYQQ